MIENKEPSGTVKECKCAAIIHRDIGHQASFMRGLFSTQKLLITL